MAPLVVTDGQFRQLKEPLKKVSAKVVLLKYDVVRVRLNKIRWHNKIQWQGSLYYCTKYRTMIQSYQDRIKVTNAKILVQCNTELYMVSVTYQRFAVGGRSLCLEEQP